MHPTVMPISAMLKMFRKEIIQMSLNLKLILDLMLMDNKKMKQKKLEKIVDVNDIFNYFIIFNCYI